jgi:hypothetical protein
MHQITNLLSAKWSRCVDEVYSVRGLLHCLCRLLLQILDVLLWAFDFLSFGLDLCRVSDLLSKRLAKPTIDSLFDASSSFHSLESTLSLTFRSTVSARFGSSGWGQSSIFINGLRHTQCIFLSTQLPGWYGKRPRGCSPHVVEYWRANSSRCRCAKHSRHSDMIESKRNNNWGWFNSQSKYSACCLLLLFEMGFSKRVVLFSFTWKQSKTSWCQSDIRRTTQTEAYSPDSIGWRDE